MSDASIPVVVPALGANGSLRLVAWLVQPGVRLIPGERLAELLVDGIVFHLEAPIAGVLTPEHAAIDTLVSEGDTIARIVPETAAES